MTLCCMATAKAGFLFRLQALHRLSHVACAGFHTFDYARHFLSCCSRMLGLEHVTSRGSIMIEYYGRDIGVKIMPTGVNPDRFLEGFSWDDTLWRREELLTQVCIPSDEILEQAGTCWCTANNITTGSSASTAVTVVLGSFCVTLTRAACLLCAVPRPDCSGWGR